MLYRDYSNLTSLKLHAGNLVLIKQTEEADFLALFKINRYRTEWRKCYLYELWVGTRFNGWNETPISRLKLNNEPWSKSESFHNFVEAICFRETNFSRCQ